MDLFPAHRTDAQDCAGLRLRPLLERIEEELHALADRVMGRAGLDVGGVLPVRASDVDGD